MKRELWNTGCVESSPQRSVVADQSEKKKGVFRVVIVCVVHYVMSVIVGVVHYFVSV